MPMYRKKVTTNIIIPTYNNVQAYRISNDMYIYKTKFLNVNKPKTH